MSDENEQHENDSQADASNADETVDFEPLTATYERLRHSTDSTALSEFARRPLPDRSDQAAFSRATALLEAVAGNAHTPVEDRVFLAETMPFPNILVKLSTDESPEVRKAVAGNADDKNWLVGRLTKDESPEVRATALRNKRTGRSGGACDHGAQGRRLESECFRSDAPTVGAGRFKRRAEGRSTAACGKIIAYVVIFMRFLRVVRMFWS